MGFKKFVKKLDKKFMAKGKRIEGAVKEYAAKAPQRRKARLEKLQYDVKVAKLQKQLKKARGDDNRKNPFEMKF